MNISIPNPASHIDKAAAAQQIPACHENLKSLAKETPATASALIAQNRVAGLPGISSGSRLASSQRAPMKFNASNTLRTLNKLTVIGAISQSPLAKAQVQQKISARVNVPTIDTLQKCDQADLAAVKKKMIAKNIYVENVPILCVEKETYPLYKAVAPDWTPEARTNCYGDAIGIADRVMPGNSLRFPITCDMLITGALKDGATLAVDDKCPDTTRQMRFVVSESRSDFHVISRGPDDKTWMQKVSHQPRIPVPPFPAPRYKSNDALLFWYKTDAKNNEGPIKLDISEENYYQWCKPMLCSLPAKIDVVDEPRPSHPPADFYAVRQRQTSIAFPEKTSIASTEQTSIAFPDHSQSL